MVRSYNFENIRALLILGFSDQELRRLCHDSLIFQPVYHELAQNTGKAEIVDRLLDYANQKEQIEPLLAWANEHNSVRYEKHQPYYEDIADENASVKATTLDSTRKVVQKTQTPPAKSGAAYDVFISYAWEDKPFTALLAIELKARGLRVWYAGFTINVGDILTDSIERGLQNSRYGVVILSPYFFAKKWPRKELGKLLEREISLGEKIILPVWHNITVTEVAKHSPTLAKRAGVSSQDGFEHVVSELLRAMGIENPEGETERVSKILEDIKKALNNQNYDKAIRLAENAQQLFPDNSELLDISVEAYYRKGVLLYRNRYFFDAINLFNDLLRLKPGHKNALKFRLIAQLQLLVIYLKNKLLVVPHSRVAQMVIAGFLILMLLGLSIYALSIDRGDSNQVTPTPTVTNSVIASVVASNRVTSTLTQILTNTLLPPTATPSPTSLPTDTPTGIFTFAPSPTSTVTLTNTSTPTATLIATPIITPSPASTVTPTNTSTPTATLPATPIITPSPTAIPLPPVTDTPIVPTGQFILLKPTSPDEPTRGFTDFEWQWGGQIDPTTHGFEVRIWREGGVPQGIHNSAEGISNSTEDYRKGKVVALGNGKYGLFVDISQAPGVLGQSGEYLWTVVLVQISPEYKDLGIQATPRHLRFAAGGRGGGGNVPNPSPPGHDTSSQ